MSGYVELANGQQQLPALRNLFPPGRTEPKALLIWGSISISRLQFPLPLCPSLLTGVLAVYWSNARQLGQTSSTSRCPKPQACIMVSVV